MPSLSQNELSQVLDFLIQRLKESGVLRELSNDSIKNIKEQLTEKILSAYSHGELPEVDLRNPTFQKALCIAITSEYLGLRNPQLKYDYTNLFLEDLSLDDVKNQITIQLKLLLTFINEMGPPEKRLSANEINQLALYIANDLANRMSEERIAKNDDIMSTLAAAITEAFINLYGIRPEGGEAVPVEVFLGNIGAFVDLTLGLAGATSFMASLNRWDPGADPQGTEWQTMNNMLQEGATAGLIGELINMHILNWAPRPEPGNATNN